MDGENGRGAPYIVGSAFDDVGDHRRLAGLYPLRQGRDGATGGRDLQHVRPAARNRGRFDVDEQSSRQSQLDAAALQQPSDATTSATMQSAAGRVSSASHDVVPLSISIRFFLELHPAAKLIAVLIVRQQQRPKSAKEIGGLQR